MGKIFRLNKSGTLGVTLTKQMKEAGFVAGVAVEWAQEGSGFVLRLKDMGTTALPSAAPTAPLTQQ